MKSIKLIDICGIEVLSRANVRKIYDYIDADTISINMDGITFISRSVADELCNILDEYKLTIEGLDENVREMLQIVNDGRKSNRDYSPKVKVSTTYNCKTMEDLRKALSFTS